MTTARSAGPQPTMAADPDAELADAPAVEPEATEPQAAEPQAAAAEPDAEPGAPARRRWVTPAWLAGCLLLAAMSLRLPAIVGYDPWVWLIWGRELTHGLPSTDGTIAWKPLPVLVTAVLAPTGAAAPQLWLWVTRAVGLAGLVGVFGLAARLAGGRAPATRAARVAGLVAGTTATAAFLLTPDGEARWLRHLLQGNIEPVTVALCVWAVRRHLDGRPLTALGLGALAGLTRPEVWPFLILYGGWLLVRTPRRWWVVGLALGAMPLLWFGGDRLLSGNPLAGAGTARVLTGSATQRLLVAMDATAAAVAAPVWVAAALAVVWAAHRRRATPAVLGAAALAWSALVAGMSGVYGYAALGRFFAPPAALLCVLAGVAVGWLVTAPVDHRAATRDAPMRGAAAVRLGVAGLLGVVVVAAAVPWTTPRVLWLPAQLDAAAARAATEADLLALVAAAGAGPGLLACGALSVDTTTSAGEVRPRLAWELGLPLARVGGNLPGPGVVTLVRRGSLLDHTLALRPPVLARSIAGTRDWVAYAEGCPAGPTAR